jgi:hypothetical protein
MKAGEKKVGPGSKQVNKRLKVGPKTTETTTLVGADSLNQ